MNTELFLGIIVIILVAAAGVYFYLGRKPSSVAEPTKVEPRVLARPAAAASGEAAKDVRQKDGENPVKADGKLYVIDGGLSKAYQAKTGIAGYTLIFNSHYLALAQHHDYISHPLSKPESDDMPTLQITQKMDKRILVSDTDAGKKLSQRIEELRLLVKAYENGSFVERAIAAYPKTIQSLHMETMEIVR